MTDVNDLLRQSATMGTKYLGVKDASDQMRESKEEKLPEVPTNKPSLFKPMEPVKPKDDEIKRANAVGFDIWHLSNKKSKESFKYMDEWIEVFK